MTLDIIGTQNCQNASHGGEGLKIQLTKTSDINCERPHLTDLRLQFIMVVVLL